MSISCGVDVSIRFVALLVDVGWFHEISFGSRLRECVLQYAAAFRFCTYSGLL